MKKLYLLVLSVLAVTGIQAQSLTATGVHIGGDPLFLMEGHAIITNVSSTSKDVVVNRTVNNVYPGHNSYFCWVQCYSSNTNLSPDFITLAPNGGFTDVFRGDLETFSVPGITTVSYCFYDMNNPSDSVCVQYIFDVSTGIADIDTEKNFISKAYPNPASTTTNFYVNLAKGSKNAQIKFFNMIGAQVKEIDITSARNSVKVNVADLKSGIYFYSLWIDGKSTTTGKLMVTRD